LKILLVDLAGCSEMKVGNVLKVALVARNPSQQQPASVVKVEALYSGCSSCGKSCACNTTSLTALVFEQLPLLGSVLQAANSLQVLTNISETNAVPGQKNTLTLHLKTNKELLANSAVEVSALHGMLPGEADIDVSPYASPGPADVLNRIRFVAKWMAQHAASGRSNVFRIPVSNQNGEPLTSISESVGFFNITAGSCTFVSHQQLDPKTGLSFKFTFSQIMRLDTKIASGHRDSQRNAIK
jgi:hypothetical protein